MRLTAVVSLVVEEMAERRTPSVPAMETTFGFNDNDEAPSEAEIKILENLRLISY